MREELRGSREEGGEGGGEGGEEGGGEGGGEGVTEDGREGGFEESVFVFPLCLARVERSYKLGLHKSLWGWVLPPRCDELSRLA